MGLLEIRQYLRDQIAKGRIKALVAGVRLTERSMSRNGGWHYEDNPRGGLEVYLGQRAA